MYKELYPKELFRVEKHIYMALDELRDYDSKRLSVCITTGEHNCFEPDRIVVCVSGEFTFRDEEIKK